ncbi:9924_t:CDS:10 [Ambispora leptoticha]|uniref:DNA mismatch repair protein MSH3 n=1 Tax=Ambispora leptoticha TaxID=144679 RepID=A0A9N8W372_9GLOM|nr:9924_t:CDS:10 [Ambispora leptoticha]
MSASTGTPTRNQLSTPSTSSSPYSTSYGLTKETSLPSLRPATTASSGDSSSNSRPATSSSTIKRQGTSISSVSATSNQTIRSKRGRPQTSVSTRDGVGGGSGENSFIVAVIEGRGVASEVGMCFIDLKTSECILSQISDSQTYVKTLHKMNLYDPAEILLSTTAFEPTKSKLCKILEENMQSATMTPIGRKYFNDVVGMNYIKQYALEEDSAVLILGLTSKFYCLSAAAAVLKYIESTQNIFFTDHSIQFKYQGCEGTMMIDCASARNLELITNITNPRSKHSLYARLLRTNILQPSTDVDIINTRLNSLEELIENEEKFFSTQTALRPFQDIDCLITALIQVPRKPTIKHAEQSINNVIMLKHTLKLMGKLRECLVGCENSLLVAIYRLLSDPRLESFEEIIDQVINEDATYQKGALGLRNQRCYAVKAGFNGLLDVARQTYKETINDIYEIVNGYTEQYKIPLKIQFSPATGFRLSTSIGNLQDQALPLVFINVSKKRKALTFTTLELMKKNTKINDSLTEVYLMSDKTIEDLISEIRKNIGVLYKASESIAMLDMLTSFAHMCTISNYVRPEFTDTLVIKAGRHPMREALYIEEFVPNDTYASDANNFQLITGPNMSGKSTYLRQIALISIMSQIGSFVPAEYASFRIVDQLFTRICNDDDMESNASTFMMEMRETGYILQNITDDSLVIVDELGRGTSTHDGLGITHAVCEEFIKTKAFVFFATHFYELTKSLTVFPNVVNLHLEVEIGAQDNQFAMKYMYKVCDGRNDDEHYGLKFGQIVGLPEDVISKASEVSHKLKDMIDASKERSSSNKIRQRRKALFQLTQHLLQIKRSSNLDKERLLGYLRMVQQEFVMKMEERRKIDTDDEKLRRVRDALKNASKEDQFLLFSKDVSYISGIKDKSSNTFILFVRDCYIHLSKLILEDGNFWRLRITGNPGIGKTFFGYYLLHQLAVRNETVIYHEYNKSPILFSEETVYSPYQDNIHEFKDRWEIKKYEITDHNTISHRLVHNVSQVEEGEVENMSGGSSTSETSLVTKPEMKKDMRFFYTMSILEFASDYIFEEDKLLFCDIEAIAPNKYCVPTQKNNVYVDTIVHPNIFFQMTVSKNHPLNINEMFNDYQAQDLYTQRKTVAQCKLCLKQYVLELDL